MSLKMLIFDLLYATYKTNEVNMDFSKYLTEDELREIVNALEQKWEVEV